MCFILFLYPSSEGRLELVRLLEKVDRNIEPAYFKTENIIFAVFTFYV